LQNDAKRSLLFLPMSPMSSESNNLANDQNTPSPLETASPSPESVVPTESPGAPATEGITDKVSVSELASPTVTDDPPVPVEAATVTVAAPVRKVAIGSQRDPADKALQPSQPKAVQHAVANPINLTGEPEPEPVVLADIKSHTGFSDDVDAEIDAVLGEISMDDVVATTEASTEEIEPGTRVKAAVTKIHEDNVFVRLSGQSEGVATLHHFKEAPNEGDLVEIIVRGLNKEDGLYELAVPGASIGVADWDDITEGAVIDALVTGSNTGGLEVTVSSIRGFIPASQIDRFRVEDFSAYIKQKLTCVVLEVNPEKRKLVLSRRAILDRENEEKRKELLEELEAGQLRDGVVTKLMDFGAFVDLGGVEGLIHVSKVSWSRVKHPSEVLSVGENVRVKVEKIDEDANRISLSHRDTLEHPWKGIDTQFAVNDIVKGTVTKIADFGAFVKIAPGIEGLVHISELAYQRVAKVGNVVKEGQELEVKIQSIDPQSQKLSLSHKACLAPPAPKQSAGKKEAAEEPVRDLAVPASGEPLKGGTDRRSGGEGVGLNW
jgi:predicted RNA-binding protein with RPS1 domain